MLRDLGVGQGDRLVLLLPNTVEQRIWVQAAKRIGAVYLCLPVTISIPSLAERVADCGAKLVLTSTAKAPLEGASLKAVALTAVTGYVPLASAYGTVRRVLEEQKSLNPMIDTDEVRSSPPPLAPLGGAATTMPQARRHCPADRALPTAP